VLGLKDSNSAEFSENTQNPVIHIMEEQKGIDKKGGTMRLGAYPCVLKEGTLAKELYGQEKISERHRHRFEYNNAYKEKLESAGMIASGTSPDGSLVEIVEIPSHKFFIAGQFHPEFKSRPDRPAPLFTALIKAAKEK
jgi:CTP synthase